MASFVFRLFFILPLSIYQFTLCIVYPVIRITYKHRRTQGIFTSFASQYFLGTFHVLIFILDMKLKTIDILVFY